MTPAELDQHKEIVDRYGMTWVRTVDGWQSGVAHASSEWILTYFGPVTVIS